jgi:NADH dehydrogenase FAD-containing subunit
VLPPGTPGVAAARQWLTEQQDHSLAVAGAGVAGVGLAAVVPHARAEILRLLGTSE